MDMEKHGIELTPTDLAILESYRNFCDGLSEYLGPGYEIVLHSLADYEHSAIKVMNGEHTGRKEGAPITDLALFMLEKIRRNGGKDIYHPYFSSNKFGEPLKSTTIPIFGEEHRIIGLLCMNFYLNFPLNQFIQNLTPNGSSTVMAQQNAPRKENFTDNVADILPTMIAEIQQELQGLSIPATNLNREIIARLQERGVFNLKNAVQECADVLGISKNTVYMHLRNLSEGK